MGPLLTILFGFHQIMITRWHKIFKNGAHKPYWDTAIISEITKLTVRWWQRVYKNKIKINCNYSNNEFLTNLQLLRGTNVEIVLWLVPRHSAATLHCPAAQYHKRNSTEFNRFIPRHSIRVFFIPHNLPAAKSVPPVCIHNSTSNTR